jgi:hypothetical protein
MKRTGKNSTSKTRKAHITDNTIYADGAHPAHIAALIISICVGIILTIMLFFPDVSVFSSKVANSHNEAIAGHIDDAREDSLNRAISAAEVVDYTPGVSRVEVDIVDNASDNAESADSLSNNRNADTLGYIYDKPGGASKGGKLIAVIERIDCRDLIINEEEASRRTITTTTRVDGASWNQVKPISVYRFAREDADPNPKNEPVNGWVENNGVCY